MASQGQKTNLDKSVISSVAQLIASSAYEIKYN